MCDLLFYVYSICGGKEEQIVEDMVMKRMEEECREEGRDSFRKLEK